jgi:Adenosine deaminase
MSPVQPLDPEACYRAVTARDSRFDGRFFSCVVSTGIYCRPICPARTPRRENVRFVRSAAEAEASGFRACLRCRPETAPDMGAWLGTSASVNRALSLIEAGALDYGDVEALANRLGMGERQLRRLFHEHLGASPISVAQTRRVLLAKNLIHQTDLAMAQVALASGFGSVRRFNETFQALYQRPPSALRRRARGEYERPEETGGGGQVSLRLPYRPPVDIADLMQGLAARGDPVVNGVWSHRLHLAHDQAEGQVRVRALGPDSLQVGVDVSDLRALPGILARVRRVFDLAADPEAINRDLSLDPVLAPLVRQRPGLRLPGHWIDEDPSAPSDRLMEPRLSSRAKAWRPWRAYAERHLTVADIDFHTLVEPENGQDAA